MGGPLGERLVQPQVIPPAHGHQVTEPHVGQLMEDGVVPGLQLAGGDAGAEQVLVTEGDAARVLHGAEVELGHEDLVVGVERVGHPEGGLEDLEAALRGGQDPVGVEELGHRRAAGHGRGKDPGLRGDLALDDVVFARH